MQGHYSHGVHELWIKADDCFVDGRCRTAVMIHGREDKELLKTPREARIIRQNNNAEYP